MNSSFDILDNHTIDSYLESRTLDFVGHFLKRYQESPWLVVFGVFLFLAIESIGNGLLFVIFYYERFGMDPKKRTVNNQLLSAICKGYMFINIFTFPYICIHLIFDFNFGKSLHKQAN